MKYLQFGTWKSAKGEVYQVTVTNKVNSTAKVNYQAGSSIQLNAGFEAKAGTVFKVDIQGRNN